MSGTMTRQLLPSSSMVTLMTSDGDSAAAMYSSGSSLYLTDVDLLTAKLVDDAGNTTALRADAGADGIDVRVCRPDGHLGAAAGFAGDGLYLDGAVEDFRHLKLEKALDKAGVGAADEHLRASGGISYLNDVDLDAVTLFELFGLDALIRGKHGFRKFAVGG